MEASRLPGRKYNIDMLRILACFMVIVLHVSNSNLHTTDVNSVTWHVLNVYDSAVRSCVPLFFMISGSVILDRDNMIPLPMLLRKNTFKLLLLYCVWSWVYMIDTVGISNLLSAKSLVAILGAPFNAKYHLWYLPRLAGVYLFSPLLFSLVKYKSGKYVKYTCAVLVTLGVLVTTVLLFPMSSKAATQIQQLIPYELCGYVGYFLVGYFLSKQNFSRFKNWHLVTALLIVIASAAAIGGAYSVALGKPSDLLYGYTNLPVFIESVIVFIIFQKRSQIVPGHGEKILLTVSRATLTIYLLHIFFLEHLQSWFGLSTRSFNAVLSVPIISIIIFIVALLVSLVLLKIPYVNKWLV